MSDGAYSNAAAATGWVGTAFSIMYLIPQVIETFQTRSVEGLTTLTIISFLVGSILWVIYGIGINSPQVVVGSAPQIMAAIIFIWFKYKKYML